MTSETVVKLGGEGGGYTISRFSDMGVWRFCVSRRDAFSDLKPNATESYGTLAEALSHINSGWPRLRASLVHPGFASELYALALKRLGPSAPALEQWAAARDNGGVEESDHE